MLLVAAFLLAVLYLSTVGFPEWLLTRVAARISTNTLAFQAQAARLDLVRGVAVVLNDVRAYRKRVVGPPAFASRQAVVVLDPFAMLRKEFCIRGIILDDGIIRPETAMAPEPSAEIAPPAPIQVWVRLRNCRIQGQEVETLAARVRRDASGWRAEEVRGKLNGRAQALDFEGSLAYSPRQRQTDVHLVTVGDPQALLPVIQAHRMTFLEDLAGRFQFGPTPPRTDITFQVRRSGDSTFSLDGNFWMQDASYQGVRLLRADGGIRIRSTPTNSLVTIDPLLVVRDEGTARVGFTVASGAGCGQVEFSGVSTLDPLAVFRMIGVLTNDISDACRLKPPYRVMARGRVDLRGQTNTDYEATAECGAVGNRLITLDNCSFHLGAVGPTNTCRDIRGTIYGGEFQGNLVFVLPRGESTDVRYRLEGNVKRVDFQKLVSDRSAQGGKDFRGVLSGDFNLEGRLGDTSGASIKGDGSLRIKDGRLFLLPLFGGLSRALTRIVPGLDFVLRQTDAKGRFVIADRRIQWDKMAVEGDVLSLTGQGTSGFDGDVDFLVQVKLMKEQTLVAEILRTMTWLISKLFEFRLTGTLDSPHWYPVNFSPDLLERLGLKGGDKLPSEPAARGPPDAGPPRGSPEE